VFMTDGPLAGCITHASLAHLMPFEGRPPSIARQQGVNARLRRAMATKQSRTAPPNWIASLRSQ
jgi:hypothetical protein